MERRVTTEEKCPTVFLLSYDLQVDLLQAYCLLITRNETRRYLCFDSSSRPLTGVGLDFSLPGSGVAK